MKKDGEKIIDAENNFFTGDEFTSLNFWAFPNNFMQVLGTYFDEFLSENSNSQKAEFYLPAAVDKAVSVGLAKAKNMIDKKCVK